MIVVGLNGLRLLMNSLFYRKVWMFNKIEGDCCDMLSLFGADEKVHFLQIGCEALENDFFLAVLYFDVVEVENCARYYSKFGHGQLLTHTTSYPGAEVHESERFRVDEFACVVDKAIWIELVSLFEDALFILDWVGGGVEDGAFFDGYFDIIIDGKKMI